MNQEGLSFRRCDVISVLYIVGVTNGLIPNILKSIEVHGIWQAALGTFGVSALVVLATGIGARLAIQSRTKGAGAADSIEFLFFFALILIPLGRTSWLAVTWLAAFEGIRGLRDPSTSGAASLFAIIAVSEFWGPAVLQVSPYFLNLEAILGAAVLNVMKGGGIKVIGNVLVTGNQEDLVVLFGCSSLQHLPYAVLCWAAVRQAIRPGWLKRDVFGLLWVAGLVIFLNTIRIALMGISDASFEIVHGPAGANVFGTIILLAAFFIAIRSAESNHDRPSSIHHRLADRDRKR